MFRRIPLMVATLAGLTGCAHTEVAVLFGARSVEGEVEPGAFLMVSQPFGKRGLFDEGWRLFVYNDTIHGPCGQMRSYRPRHFDLRELVAPDVYMTRGESAWELLDPRGLALLDALRDKWGPVIVNDWHLGGTYMQSGLRDPVTGMGARLSQHKAGRAFDCKFKDTTPQAVYAYLLEHADEFPGLTTLEDIEFTSTWLHVDVRAANWAGIRVVKP